MKRNHLVLSVVVPCDNDVMVIRFFNLSRRLNASSIRSLAKVKIRLFRGGLCPPLPVTFDHAPAGASQASQHGKWFLQEVY